MPGFHVFYCRHRTGDGIASHAPAPMEAGRIGERWPTMCWEQNGDFLGLVDEDDSVLQFMVLARGEGDEQPIRMEIPDVRQGANLIRHISNAELSSLLRNLPDKLTTDVVTKAGAISKGS